MYGVTALLELPISEDPKLEQMETFLNLENAISRANELLDIFVEEYGEDYSQKATTNNMMAIGYNGEVTWRAYIAKINNII